MRATPRRDPLLSEVRALLGRDRELPERMRRLQRMENAAQVWVNGRAVGKEPAHTHLYETYD